MKDANELMDGAAGTDHIKYRQCISFHFPTFTLLNFRLVTLYASISNKKETKCHVFLLQIQSGHKQEKRMNNTLSFKAVISVCISRSVLRNTQV